MIDDQATFEEEIRMVREKLREMENKLRVSGQRHRSPVRAGGQMSSTVEKRPPWNHGGGLVHGRQSRASLEARQRTPVRTRSASRKPVSGPLEAQPPNQLGSKGHGTVVHKFADLGISQNQPAQRVPQSESYHAWKNVLKKENPRSFCSACNAALSTSPKRRQNQKERRKKERTPIETEIRRCCSALEQSGDRVEKDIQRLKEENDQLKKECKRKSEQLVLAQESLQDKEKELIELGRHAFQFESELLALKAKMAVTSPTRASSDKVAILEKRVAELADRERDLSIHVNMLLIERDKLSVMLSAKEGEVALYKKEIALTDRRKGLDAHVRSADGQDLGGGKNESMEVAPPVWLKTRQAEEPMEVVAKPAELSVLDVVSADSDAGLHPRGLPLNRPKLRGASSLRKLKRGRSRHKDELEPRLGLRSIANTRESPTEACNASLVEVESPPQKPYRYFSPVTRRWQFAACARWDLVPRQLLMETRKIRPLTSPAAVFRTVGDGNCFFRSISVFIVGDQEEHGLVRKLVVDYMREHLSEFEAEIDEAYLGRMSEEGEWATDVEIRATARLLGTPIYTYNRYNSSDWQWQRFVPVASLDESLDGEAVPSLYIQNTSSCHYDVVMTVTHDGATALSDSYRQL